MTNYDYYNREERAICSHLFRLLHENLGMKSKSPLGQLLNKLHENRVVFRNGLPVLSMSHFDNTAIYCEASIIRDAYQNAKPNIYPFMDTLTRIIIKQEQVNECRLYSQLPNPLNDPQMTHPKQIRQKASSESIQLSEGECKVYGSMQGMFNAKPDLVITIDNLLLVCEAKHTEPFDEEQLKRTWNITEVWAEMLYKDLGYKEPPDYSVFKLGAGIFKPHITWSMISEIADQTYAENDRSRIAIKAGVDLIKRKNLE